MSTDLRLASWPSVPQSPPRLHRIGMLKPALARQPAASKNKWSAKSLLVLLVMLAHAGVFAALLAQSEILPLLPEEPAAPIMVSLVSESAPEPEIVPIVPEPPKPEPVVKKTEPKPKPEPKLKPQPVPEPIAESPPPVQQALPPEPVTQPAIVQEVAPAPQPAPVKQAEVVEKIEPEPVIEPPSFGAAYLRNPPPRYPTLSRRMGEEGRVLLRVLVATSGSADNVEIETGSGSRRLDEAALEAVRKWKFVPAKRNNQPISAYVLVPVKFSLQDS